MELIILIVFFPLHINLNSAKCFTHTQKNQKTEEIPDQFRKNVTEQKIQRRETDVIKNKLFFFKHLTFTFRNIKFKMLIG